MTRGNTSVTGAEAMEPSADPPPELSFPLELSLLLLSLRCRKSVVSGFGGAGGTV
jgi:hypothetical protein